ncbi:MAG: hypothetical protein ACP5I6_05635 [Caldisphaera sp.]|nr:hypothetical protein [Caldisphaera sp.]PMP59397.1 MAG: hypothetical protein C0202_02585 [Caldisphaera sp.]
MRITLSWEYCELCKRRLPTSICKINNKYVRVCPYCIALLSDNKKMSCEGKKSSVKQANYRKKLEPDEDFLKKVGESLGK